MINYNGLPDLPDLLNSLKAQNTRDFNPVFWDNASTDGSVEYVRDFLGHKHLELGNHSNRYTKHTAAPDSIVYNPDTNPVPSGP